MSELNPLLEKQFVALMTLLGVSAVAGFAQLLTAVAAELRWNGRMKSEVGSPGAPYAAIIVWPLSISIFVIVTLAVGSLAALLAGALLVIGTTRWYTMWVLNHSLWIVVVYALVAPLVQFNAVPRVLLWAWKQWKYSYSHLQPGWINAKWQLEHYDTFLAMNINEQGVERLASAVFSYIVREKKPFPEGPARGPENLTPDELANYLLVACAVEKCIHELNAGQRQVGNAAWEFLRWARSQPSRPFGACQISDDIGSGQSFYSQLRNLAQPPANPVGTLPDSIYIDGVVEKVRSRLSGKFEGHGSRMLRRHFLGSGFRRRRLIRELREFAGYEDGSEEGVFLKLAVDHRLWEVSDSEPFVFPYNEGVALLFLNSGCVVASFDTNTVPQTKETRDLMKEAEDRLVRRVHALLKRFKSYAPALEFSSAVFKKGPAEVTRWELTDYLDWWLWDHARKQCRSRNQSKSPSSSIAEKIRSLAYNLYENRGRQDGFAEDDWRQAEAEVCRLSISEGGPCCCDASKSPWHAEETQLRRD
jgi:hypothetical protein